MLNIAILGFGNIGSGVADVFIENGSVISKKIGDTVNIKYILDKIEIKNHPFSDRQAKDFETILNDPDIDLIVETMGGSDFAYKCTKAALEKGINVVTPNKELVAKYGAELLKIAAEKDVRYFFEASVGGGIPIIRPIYNCLAANKINKIAAILNGTTNFILTKMSVEKWDFETALKTAQELGYAESDPTDDVEGKDACRKICILSSLAFGRQLPPEKVHTEGISRVTLEDIKNAEKLGFKIKLIAKSQINHINQEDLDSDSLSVMVAPMLVPRTSPLYNIDDVFNGILVNGNAVGDVMFYGRGAGKLPTASAIAADIIDALLKKTENMMWDISDGNYVSDYKNQSSGYYIHVGFNQDVISRNSVFDLISELLPQADTYKSLTNNQEMFFTTDIILEKELDKKIKSLSDSGVNILSKIRIL